MPGSLYWAYVGFVDTPGGKTRPVLHLRTSDDAYIVFRVSSRYADKSDFIRSKYVEIHDWRAAGLPKPSWIDTVKTYQLPTETTNLTYIGQLTQADLARLVANLG